MVPYKGIVRAGIVSRSTKLWHHIPSRRRSLLSWGSHSRRSWTHSCPRRQLSKLCDDIESIDHHVPHIAAVPRTSRMALLERSRIHKSITRREYFAAACWPRFNDIHTQHRPVGWIAQESPLRRVESSQVGPCRQICGGIAGKKGMEGRSRIL
jgi:hypothetical protein